MRNGANSPHKKSRALYRQTSKFGRPFPSDSFTLRPKGRFPKSQNNLPYSSETLEHEPSYHCPSGDTSRLQRTRDDDEHGNADHDRRVTASNRQRKRSPAIPRDSVSQDPHRPQSHVQPFWHSEDGSPLQLNHGSTFRSSAPSNSRTSAPGPPGSGIIATPLTVMRPRTSSGPRVNSSSSHVSTERLDTSSRPSHVVLCPLHYGIAAHMDSNPANRTL